MDYPMHAELEIGNKFPDFELPDQAGTPRNLSDLLRGFPGTLIFGRGHYCPKDRRQLTNYVIHLQPEMRINYCKLITVSVDDKTNTNETRDALAAQWPFLMDPDRRLLYELQMVDTTDPAHGEVYVPYSFSLDQDRTIHKIYNGWYYVGRPTVEDIRQNWRALLSRRPEYVYDPSRAPGLKGDAFYDRNG